MFEHNVHVAIMLTPSTPLKNGTAPQEKLATTARGDVSEEYFNKELEEMLVNSAKLKFRNRYKSVQANSRVRFTS